MEVTGWRIGSPNISTGAGFGIRIKIEDREAFFQRDWKTIRIEISPGKTFRVNLSGSFWAACPELRSKWLGRWMLEKGLAPWSKSSPPRINLDPIGDGLFRLKAL